MAETLSEAVIAVFRALRLTPPPDDSPDAEALYRVANEYLANLRPQPRVLLPGIAEMRLRKLATHADAVAAEATNHDLRSWLQYAESKGGHACPELEQAVSGAVDLGTLARMAARLASTQKAKTQRRHTRIRGNPFTEARLRGFDRDAAILELNRIFDHDVKPRLAISRRRRIRSTEPLRLKFIHAFFRELQGLHPRAESPSREAIRHVLRRYRHIPTRKARSKKD